MLLDSDLPALKMDFLELQNSKWRASNCAGKQTSRAFCPNLASSARKGPKTRVERPNWHKNWRSTPRRTSTRVKFKLSLSTHQVGPGSGFLHQLLTSVNPSSQSSINRIIYYCIRHLWSQFYLIIHLRRLLITFWALAIRPYLNLHHLCIFNGGVSAHHRLRVWSSAVPQVSIQSLLLFIQFSFILIPRYTLYLTLMNVMIRDTHHHSHL